MPWTPVTGPTGSVDWYYMLPAGLTGVGTVGQIVAFLLDSYNVPRADPGVTGAVWNNNLAAAVSKGVTGA